METLFENQTTDANGDPAVIPLAKVGDFISRTVYITGTLDGATFSLEATAEVNPSAGDWVTVPDSDVILPSPVNILIRAANVRGVLSGGGGSLDATVKLY